MSRSEIELQRRVDILVKTIEKEIETEQKVDRKINRNIDIEMMSQQDDDDIDMKSNESGSRQDVNDEDDEDEEAQVRVGNGSEKLDNLNQVEEFVIDDDFEGLDEAAQIYLKKPRLN